MHTLKRHILYTLYLQTLFCTLNYDPKFTHQITSHQIYRDENKKECVLPCFPVSKSITERGVVKCYLTGIPPAPIVCCSATQLAESNQSLAFNTESVGPESTKNLFSSNQHSNHRQLQWGK